MASARPAHHVHWILVVLALVPACALQSHSPIASVAVASAKHGTTRHESLSTDISALQKGRGADSQILGSSKPKQPGWFGDFSQTESSYDQGGMDAYLGLDSARAVHNGIDVGHPAPLDQMNVAEARWFHESPSGGSAVAWQTHYPAVDGSIVANRNVHNNLWRATPENWVQDYVPFDGHHAAKNGRKPAFWFDDSVGQLDGFGRQLLPDVGDPRRLLDIIEGDPWVERSVNTSIECAEVGCTGNVTLQAFDADTEQGKNCKLDIALHPTDFDNDHSDEHVNNWMVNGYSVNSLCDPMARGCNKSAWRPLVSCLRDYSVDHLLDGKNGQLSVQGTLSPDVDECPYNGNLLSGVVSVTCMVRPIPPPPPQPPEEVNYISMAAAPLRCKRPGCTARVVLNVNPEVAFRGGSCFLNVTVNQTDYDNEVPSAPETIEFLALDAGHDLLNDINMSVDVEPGKNPCKSRYEGAPLSSEDTGFALLNSKNVTAQVLAPPAGSLVVTGKISEHVDECAHAGYLFNAWVSLICEAVSVSPPK